MTSTWRAIPLVTYACAVENAAVHDERIERCRRVIGVPIEAAEMADAFRQIGREPEGEKVLRRGLAAMPRDADLRHSLGLLLTRKGDKAAALSEFVQAARLAPDNARYAYVHAIAVDSAGNRKQALALLRSANKRHPDDLDILGALLSISRETGDRQAALRYAKQLAEILPGNPGLSRLIAELEAK